MVKGGNHQVLVRRTHQGKSARLSRCRWTGYHRQCRDVRGKVNSTQRSLTPERFKKWRFLTYRDFVHISSNVKISHLHWISRRSLRLLGSRITQADSSRTHIPEVATVEIVLGIIVVKDRRKRGVSVSLWSSTTYSFVRPLQLAAMGGGVGDRHGSWVSRSRCIEE